MKKKLLGKTDLYLSQIGLGTWAMGGHKWAHGWGVQEDKDSIAAILESLELGINWIDTAALYGHGYAEKIIKKALREWKEPVIIATKCGVVAKFFSRGIKGKLKRRSIKEECENSLRRLGVDSIDLYQIHWPVPDADIEEAFQALQELKLQGKIRWAGVSNFNAAQLSRVSKYAEVASLQSPYSMLKRNIDPAEIDWCKNHQCGLLIYSPLQSGIFTDKFNKSWVGNLPENDWRRRRLTFINNQSLNKSLRFVESIKKLAKENNYSIVHLAVAWVLRKSEVTAAIVGARRKGQIREVIPAVDLQLSSQILEQIEDQYKLFYN